MGTGPYLSSYAITQQRGWSSLCKRAISQYVSTRLSAYIPLSERWNRGLAHGGSHGLFPVS